MENEEKIWVRIVGVVGGRILASGVQGISVVGNEFLLEGQIEGEARGVAVTSAYSELAHGGQASVWYYI